MIAKTAAAENSSSQTLIGHPPTVTSCRAIFYDYFEVLAVIVDEIRWDEKAGLRRDAVRSQVIDVL
jgi:hypothetical protein